MQSNYFQPLGRNTAQLYAEYRDDIENYNKKQDMLLQRHLRVLRRQERVADSFQRKNKREIQQLKEEIKNNDERQQSMNLTEYDNLKYFQKFTSNDKTKPKKYKYVQESWKPNDGSEVSSVAGATPRKISVSSIGNHSVKLPPLRHREDWEMSGYNGGTSRYLQDSEPKALSVRALKRSSRVSGELSSGLPGELSPRLPPRQLYGTNEVKSDGKKGNIQNSDTDVLCLDNDSAEDIEYG